MVCPQTVPEAERYDIPEDSEIVDNIVVDEHSKRLKRENPRAYSNIIRMAKRLRMKVRFVKNLTDENGNVLDGFITSKGIFINADAKNPSRFVATHEFGHRMKQAAPEVWVAYQEYVINKLKKESFGNGMTAYDILYEETKNAYEKNDTDSINEEIAVNYAGELFNSEEMLESFIREDKSLALKVRDWWYKVLESMGLLSEKKKAQQMWLRAYTAAGENVKKGKVGEFSGEKLSIQKISGEKGDYGIGVYLDSDLLTGLTDAERIQAVKEHIKKLGGREFVAYDKNRKPVKIRIAEHSQRYENRKGDNVRVNRDLTSYLNNKVKQEALVLVDELIETAKEEISETSRYSHGWLDNYGKNNWDYWKVFIQEKNKTVWEATLNVTNSSNGEKILYDIFPIEMVEQGVTSPTSTTNPIVTQNKPSVNSHSRTVWGRVTFCCIYCISVTLLRA
ncbi:MAG: hypothetical protein IJX50_02350 [Clostridia bacterium]|nr:hypothetical protein [Clostridia bacterium]